jgi:hypothetical protein
MAGLRVPAKCLPVQRLPPSRRYRMSYLRRSTLSSYVSITLADRDRVSTSHAGTAVGRALDITGHDVTQLARPDGLSPQNHLVEVPRRLRLRPLRSGRGTGSWRTGVTILRKHTMPPVL